MLQTVVTPLFTVWMLLKGNLAHHLAAGGPVWSIRKRGTLVNVTVNQSRHGSPALRIYNMAAVQNRNLISMTDINNLTVLNQQPHIFFNPEIEPAKDVAIDKGDFISNFIEIMRQWA